MHVCMCVHVYTGLCGYIHRCVCVSATHAVCMTNCACDGKCHSKSRLLSQKLKTISLVQPNAILSHCNTCKSLSCPFLTAGGTYPNALLIDKHNNCRICEVIYGRHSQCCQKRWQNVMSIFGKMKILNADPQKNTIKLT